MGNKIEWKEMQNGINTPTAGQDVLGNNISQPLEPGERY